MASPAIDVYVKLPSGRVISADFLPTDQVKAVYKHVAEEEGVNIARVQLKYQGKILKQSHALGYLGVCKETILKAEIISVKNLNLFVKDKEGCVTPISINNCEYVSDIKEKIEVATGCSALKQILKKSGCILNKDNMTVTESGLKDEDIIALEVKDTAPVKHNNKPDTVDEALDEQKKEEVISSFDAGGRNVEVVFCFDTTGSMYSCLTQVRAKVRESVTRLLHDIPNIRIGIIAMGDYCDQESSYVIKMEDLTQDSDLLVNFVKDVPSSGGGDSPECYEWALRKAQTFDWAEDSAKALVMIGDCLPHPVSYTDQHINWHTELDVLAGMGVKVYGVQALNVSESTPFYEELAERSGGAYINFSNFGIITDMFLAVCYNESSPEQLQAYCQEVEDQGRMTDETKQMFTKLEETQEEKKVKKKEKPKRHIKEPWWDPQLDTNSTPQYCYDAEKDHWASAGSKHKTSSSKVTKKLSLSSPSTESPVTSYPTTKSKKTFWQRLSIKNLLSKKRT
ncbi:unnamed protein product [Owenia fusiformis]|uniref:Uncharacterized protein n=1 Tax=Owenia fusiformis TaxID=6347 RepID=A0A8J1Y5D6_OWEFU|nr:unnamed protein product [Owenia fusiformis]